MSVQKPRTTRPEFLPLSIARMLWKHRFLVVGSWIPIGLAGCMIVYLLPLVYKAEAVVLVDSQKIPETFVTSTVQVSLQDSLTTISQRVLSATRLHKIITDFDLYAKQRKRLSIEEIAAEMRKDLVVTPVQGWAGGRSAAFRVSYECGSPKTAAAVANKVAALFIGENVTTREQRAENTTDFLETQLDQAKQSLEQQEQHLSRYKLQHRGELPQQETALLSTLSTLQSELQGNQDALNRAEQNKVIVENSLASAESAVANLARSMQPAPRSAGPRVSANQPLQRSSDTEALRAKIKALEARYSEEHPDVKRLRSELAMAGRQQDIENRATSAQSDTRPTTMPTEQTVPPQLIADLNREKERVQTLRLQLGLINKDLSERSTERRQILRSISMYQGQLERLPLREQEMASVVRDYEMSKQNYSSLLSKKLSAEMAGEMERRQQSEHFTLLEPARIPSAPVKPKRAVLCAVSGVGSLALCIGLALALELKRNCILGEWELPPEWNIIGRISLISATGEPPAISRDALT